MTGTYLAVKNCFLKLLLLKFQVNTCPIDRRVFNFIVVYNRIGGNEIAREKCKQKKTREETEAEEAAQLPEEAVLCERCGCGDRADVLLLCDGEYFLNLIFDLELFNTLIDLPNIIDVRMRVTFFIVSDEDKCSINCGMRVQRSG